MCVCFFSKDHHSQPQKDQKKDTVSNSEMTAFYFFHRDFPNVCIPDSSATLSRRYSAPNLSLHREMSKDIPLQDSQKGQIISLDVRTSLMVQFSDTPALTFNFPVYYSKQKTNAMLSYGTNSLSCLVNECRIIFSIR